MSLQSRQRHQKRPNATEHPLVPRPYKHPIPQKFTGIFTPLTTKTRGAFGGRSRLTRQVQSVTA